MEQLIVFGTLVVVMLLFAWGRLRHDVVAMMALFILVLTGVVDAVAAFSGFGHPAVITVAAVLIIGKGLEYSGVVDLLATKVTRIGSNLILQIGALCMLVAVASAFMNNVGALAIFMPVAIYMARANGHAPSLYLMPLAFASLLGGMTTLIGTPPNIIIAIFRQEQGLAGFGMLDFAPVGILIALAGLVFITFIGWRLLPERKTKNDRSELFDIDDYITEVVLGPESKLVGSTIQDLPTISKAEVQVLGIVRKHRRIHAPEPEEELLEGDIIILETDTDELSTFLQDTEATLVGDRKLRREAAGSDQITIMEAVVLADSPLIGKTASSLKMRSRYRTNLLALARKEQKIHRRLDHAIFRTGDVLLLQGRDQDMAATISQIGCLPLARRDLRLDYRTKIPLALSLFGAAILTVIAGLLPVDVAFSLCALVMVLAGSLPLKNVYTSVDWPVIILLAAMIPVGVALETSGGAATMAGLVLWSSNMLPPWAVLAIILVLTMFISDIINNAATVVLMAPIAIHIARDLGHSIDPYLMAVAIGGSSAFLTPIGHQSNTLVMGPGGYKFTDYWRMGLPLELIIVLVGVPAILHFWPL